MWGECGWQLIGWCLYPIQIICGLTFVHLIWDVFAISTYLTVSLLFWYMGLVPDIASMRDRAKGIKRALFSLYTLAGAELCGSGITMKWAMVFSSVSDTLSLSVHSIVSWDFAMSAQPGWHTTIFPLFCGRCHLVWLCHGLYSCFTTAYYVSYGSFYTC